MRDPPKFSIINTLSSEKLSELKKWSPNGKCFTVKPGKLWIPEIFLECYCVAKKKANQAWEN